MDSKTNNKTLIVVVGATASGKTSLAIDIAKRYSAEIISADSRQFYRQMNIGTATPNSDELGSIKHHFIDSHDVWDNYAAGAFEKDALNVINTLFMSSDYVVMVGGSGLYIDAVCSGFDDIPEVNIAIRRELTARYESEGLDLMLEELKELDILFYNSLDKANYKRVIRALEVCIATGQPYSLYRKGEGKERDFNIVKYAIDMPRELLYDRINRRVDIMISEGLEAEAQSVLEYRASNALQTVGYRELFDYFDGSISLERAVELIKQNSRRYAKRQMTWFRRDSSLQWIKGIDQVIL